MRIDPVILSRKGHYASAMGIATKRQNKKNHTNIMTFAVFSVETFVTFVIDCCDICHRLL